MMRNLRMTCADCGMAGSDDDRGTRAEGQTNGFVGQPIVNGAPDPLPLTGKPENICLR
jgi:hypothetical protein